MQLGASTSSNTYHANPWDYEVAPDEDFKVSVILFIFKTKAYRTYFLD